MHLRHTLRYGEAMVAPRPNNRVVVVAYDQMTTFEYAVPTEVFGLERPELDEFYTMAIAAGEPGPLRAAFGLTVCPEGGLDLIRQAGTVVIPGWRDRFEPPPEPLLAALRDAHGAGARLVSVCSGAFVLAATGLLDGHGATTHWHYAEDLQRLYPTIAVNPDVLFIDNGTTVTSAGSAAGIDACLHVVREDWGAHTASIVARRLVVSPQRDGGQAQHRHHPDPQFDSTTEFGSLLAEIETNLDGDHAIATMAERVHLSPRTFQRRFTHTIGVSPSTWISQRRLHRARELLETTDASIEEIALAVGYTSAVSLRSLFRHHLKTTPTAYRRRNQR